MRFNVWVWLAYLPLNRCLVEPMTGIEPAYSAWEVDSARLRAFTGVHVVLAPMLTI
jgi:hypothetical protein